MLKADYELYWVRARSAATTADCGNRLKEAKIIEFNPVGYIQEGNRNVQSSANQARYDSG